MNRVLYLSMFLVTVFVLSVQGPPNVNAEETTKARPEVISLATMRTGTLFNTLSVGMANILTKYSGVKVTAESLGGLGAWGPLMEKGDVQLGMINGWTVSHYAHATGPNAGQKKRPWLRLLMTGHVTRFTFFTQPRTGIKTVPDLRGKKVFCLFPPSPSADISSGLLFKYYGIYEDVVKLKIPSSGEMVRAVIEGRADAYFWTMSPYRELERSGGCVVIPIEKAALDYVHEQEPAIHPAIIPAGYSGLKEDVPCVGFYATLVTSKDVDGDLIYNLVKTFFEHQKEFSAIHPRAAEWDLKGATLAPVLPFHPGAIRFYKEKGLWTPSLESLQQKLLETAK